MRWAWFTTVTRRGHRPIGELSDQRCGLVLAQASQPAVCGDVEPFHDLGRPHLAHSRQCLQHIDDLGVGNDVVGLGEIEYLSKVVLAGTQSFLISARRRRASVAASRAC